jgi:hypothetical protein
MQKVSVRTLALLVVLLLAVASHQYMAITRPSTGVIWLAGDCDRIEYYHGTHGL